MLKKIEIFTDGSCLRNPGPGGYGSVLRYNRYKKTFSAGYLLTTNNRMELMAVITALEALTDTCIVTLTTDSQYVRQGITLWSYNWKQQGWKTTKKKLVKNIDLWKRLSLVAQNHLLTWKWIQGHTGHLENELCNQLAHTAATYCAVLQDQGYSCK